MAVRDSEQISFRDAPVSPDEFGEKPVVDLKPRARHGRAPNPLPDKAPKAGKQQSPRNTWALCARESRLLQQQGRLPADALGVGLEFLERPVLNLADAFLADPEQMTDLAQAVGAVTGQTESQVENLPLTGAKVFHQEAQGFLTFVVFLHHQRAGIWHSLGQLEIAVVVKDGIEADRGAGGGLEVRQVFETAAGSAGEFLRARQVLATVCQGFGFLLQEAEFLKVVRRQAHEMALASNGDLERLANPPRGVGREAGAVRNVEAIDRLHQPTDGFLKKIAVSEAMVAEPLGDVGREADVRAGESVLVVDVAIAKPTNRHHFTAFIVAVFADELGHGPGFEGRSACLKFAVEGSDQHPDEFALTVPKTGKQLPFFFWREQVGRKSC